MNKLFGIMTLGLIFCIVFMTGCSKRISTKPITNKITELKFENIKSARIELASTGGNSSKSYTFDFDNSDHTKILKDVIQYLNSAKIQGNADEKVTNKGGSPTYLILELKDGSDIRIKSAVGGKVTKLSNGSIETSQFDIPNEVTISKNSNEEPYRIQSPEIRELIDNGYKNLSDASSKLSQFDISNEITLDPNCN
jgi:hypothetical protein